GGASAVSTGGKAATKGANGVSRAETTNAGLRTRLRPASAQGERGAVEVSAASTACSGVSSSGATQCSDRGRRVGAASLRIADPRADQSVGHVHEAGGQQEGEEQQRHQGGE